MNRVMISIGGFNIYWYSFLILVAFFIGALIAVSYTKKINFGEAFIADLIMWLIPVSIIGARAYYVIFNYDYYRDDFVSIFKIWEGGLAIYGGVILSILFILYYSKKKEKSFITTLDILAPSLILGQAIGRWGNFFNSEAYGPVTSFEFLNSIHLPKFIIEGMNINGVYYQPMFLYESIWCLIGFLILLLVRKRSRKKGTQVSFYLLWYGAGRIIIEYYRLDSLYLGNYKISQILSIVMVVVGALGLLLNTSKKDKSNDINLVNGRI